MSCINKPQVFVGHDWNSDKPIIPNEKPKDLGKTFDFLFWQDNQVPIHVQVGLDNFEGDSLSKNNPNRNVQNKKNSSKINTSIPRDK